MDNKNYCQKHDQSHFVFKDDTTACLLCINETVEEKEKDETTIFYKILATIPKKEQRLLSKWAGSIYVLTGEWEPRIFLKEVVAKAYRLKKTVDEMLEQIVKEESVRLILSE